MASQREIRFYERVRKHSPELLHFLAGYAGRAAIQDPERVRRIAVKRAEDNPTKEKSKPRKPGSDFIAISDLTLHFTRPNIIDVKLGTLHHSQDRAVLKPVKYKTAVTLGYCIGGKLKWNYARNTYEHIDKYAGRELDENTITDVLADYVSPNSSTATTESSAADTGVVDALLARLQALLAYFNAQRTWRFHSTSLLILYERTDAGSVLVDVRLVDFAHAYLNHEGIEGREPQQDEGCRLGVTSLIQDLLKIKARAALNA